MMTRIPKLISFTKVSMLLLLKLEYHGTMVVDNSLGIPSEGYNFFIVIKEALLLGVGALR